MCFTSILNSNNRDIPKIFSPEYDHVAHNAEAPLDQHGMLKQIILSPSFVTLPQWKTKTITREQRFTKRNPLLGLNIRFSPCSSRTTWIVQVTRSFCFSVYPHMSYFSCCFPFHVESESTSHKQSRSALLLDSTRTYLLILSRPLCKFAHLLKPIDVYIILQSINLPQYMYTQPDQWSYAKPKCFRHTELDIEHLMW